jgi:nitronate monooxygenase
MLAPGIELTLAVTVETRLTRRFGLTHPIVSAPMAFVAGGRLAAAVTYAGGLGLIGGGTAIGPGLRASFARLETRRLGAGSSVGRSNPFLKR